MNHTSPEWTEGHQQASEPDFYGNWIDVNIEQPKPFQTVIVACYGGATMTSKYYGKENCDFIVRGKRGRKDYGKYGRYFEAAENHYVVQYWMPKPEHPDGHQ